MSSRPSPSAEIERDQRLLKRGVPRVRRDIPDDIFFSALETLLSCKRLDLKQLATDLGVARMTLYRKVKGGRDDLLGAVMLHVMEFMLVDAISAGNGLAGIPRFGAITRRMVELMNANAPLRFLLSSEPECALRLLTTKSGPIQTRMVTFTDLLIQAETQAGQLAPTMPTHSLAYLLVRIAETFMYADVIADEAPDSQQAYECVMAMLETQRAGARRH